jgi:arsenate reductase (glutaredoxin)
VLREPSTIDNGPDTMQVTIYHNPNCSNSRRALEIIRARGIEPMIVEYPKTPLSKSELKQLAQKLKSGAGEAWDGVRSIVREKEAPFTELNLDRASDDQLLDAIAANPILLNRPIVVTDKGARLCRPPELVSELL